MDGWFFAYGSLMWDPEVPVASAHIARLDGYTRSFCLRSTCHRGTEEVPGLVLGLQPNLGAVCHGMAYRVETTLWPESLARIRARELVTEAYREAQVSLCLQDGQEITAIAYVMRDGHPQNMAGLSLEAQAAMIARAHGGRGSNADYLFNTVAHLHELGMPDADLDRLAAEVRQCLNT